MRLVKKVLLGVALVTLYACLKGSAKEGATDTGRHDRGVPMEEMRIEETTLARIDGWKVAVGNIWEREYKDADGKIKKGPVASLSIVKPGASEAKTEEVGTGSILDLGEAGKWAVIKVVEGKGTDTGYIALRRQ